MCCGVFLFGVFFCLNILMGLFKIVIYVLWIFVVLDREFFVCKNLSFVYFSVGGLFCLFLCCYLYWEYNGMF